MAVEGAVRNKIIRAESIIKLSPASDVATRAALAAIIEALKEISGRLDELEPLRRVV